MESMKFVCPHCLKTNKLPIKEHYTKANCGYCKKSLLDGKIIEANDYNFDSIINSATVPVVVDFWAEWCGPCKMMAPNFAEASKTLAPHVQFVKVNTEQAPNISARYGIRSIPTIIKFKNGQEINRTSGALPTHAIIDFAKS